MHHVKLILLFSLCIWMSANAQTPYDSFAPETSRPILTSEALSKEKCAQDFSSDTTLLVAMIDTQQERILLVDMSDGSIVAYALLTDNKSHWLSPDPLLDKYPEISPYAYCAWNPLKYVDPDGERVFFAPDVSEAFKKDFEQAVTYMNQKGISGMLYQLEKSLNIYYISEGIGMNGSEFDSNTNTIKWFSRVGLITDNLYEMSPVEILNHEIDHALQHDINPIQQKKDYKTKDSNYMNLEEKRVITGSEQKTAQKLHKLKTGEFTRNNHNGSIYETTSPITTEDKWVFTPSMD